MEVSREVRAKHFPSTSLDLYFFYGVLYENRIKEKIYCKSIRTFRHCTWLLKTQRMGEMLRPYLKQRHLMKHREILHDHEREKLLVQRSY